MRSGVVPKAVAETSDFLLVHFNGTTADDVPKRVEVLRKFGKPLVCNEDTKTGNAGAMAAELCVSAGCSWGLMLEKANQHYPFSFRGAADDRATYATLKKLTTP